MFAFGFPFKVYMCGHNMSKVCLCGPEVDVWSPFQLISTLFIDVGFLSLSEVLLIYIIWLAGLFCGSSYPPCYYENDSLSTTSTQNICGFYGSEYQSSCLCAKYFAIRAISSALYLQLLYACIRDNC